MKKCCSFFLGISLFLSIQFLHAQFAADPNDSIYQDLSLWEGKGILRHLPALRPYPPQVILDALERVVQRGSRSDAEKAKAYLEEYQKSYRIHLEAGGSSRYTGDDFYGDLYGKIEAGGWIGESMHLEGRLEGLVMDNTSGFVLPEGQRTSVDIFDTWADVTVKDRKLNLRQSQVVDFSVGKTDIYFKAGIERNSFGPFWDDSVVLSPEAPHAGHYSFVWRNSWFSYTTVLLELAATDYINDTDNDTYMENEKFPDKHLVLQSFNFYPTSWLEMGFFETIVWGGRFDLIYLLPFKELFYAQSMAGFNDNSFMGLLANVRIKDSFQIPLLVYVDDTNLNDLLQFDFSTKFKVALQVGAKYTPKEGGILRRIGADYLLVTPYMYTHRSGLEEIKTDADARFSQLSAPNYTNYTHMGTNLGVGLDPNSDRFTLSVQLEPIKNLTVDIRGRLMRHGNASEAMSDDERDERNDGSILDDGYNKYGKAIFHYNTRFLNQSVIEKVWQAGFNASYRIPLGPGAVLLEGGYTFEYWEDKDLVKGRTDTTHYINVGLGYRF
ncbi:MAG TPA: hypothetical protein PLG79_03045 [Spirochaetales bacterium]|nr:hypothetical protein [Spirochaetales bacterium]